MDGLFRYVRWFLVLQGMILLLAGCGKFSSWFSSPEEDRPPNVLASDATRDLESGYYDAAIEGFQTIKDRYPYSEFATQAEMLIAEAYFKKGEYEEAYEAYNEFERLHPKNPGMPRILYQKGLCNYNQIKSIDRDHTPAYLAKEDFERLIQRFPESEQASKANLKIRECNIYLAEHELYVARFYFNKKKYPAARDRFKGVIENYPDYGQYNEAIEYLAKCNAKIAEQQTEEKSQKKWFFF